MTLDQPALSHVCDLNMEIGPVRQMGQGRAGMRRIVPVIGGTVTGPRLSGKLLNVGADWQTTFHDGVADIDARHAMETDDGAVIEIVNSGFRHGPPEIMAAMAQGADIPPDAYYMRTVARLETGDERYAWVNRTLFLGAGAKLPESVLVSLFAVE